MKHVDILLLTYNGERYLKEQIDSILAQSFKNWKLFIRDDESHDGTNNIIDSYCAKYPDKICRIPSHSKHVGIVRGAFELLSYSESSYVLYCDQDDVWYPNKVATLYRCIRAKEKEHGKIPILIHAAALTTDKNLHPLANTESESILANLGGYNPYQSDFLHLLFKNVVQGASMIFNQKLREELMPFINMPSFRGALHDSLIASVASISGKIFYYSKPLMYYRQHEKNVMGMKKSSPLSYLRLSEGEREKWRIQHLMIIDKSKCDILYRYYKTSFTMDNKRIMLYLWKRRVSLLGMLRYQLWRYFNKKELCLMLIFGNH